jgi:hypothetical protein
MSSHAANSAPEHVVLFGDSIFDNAAYTRGQPSVIEHLRRELPPAWTASLCAVDGSTTRTLPAQLNRMPGGVTRAVVAIGGNDALAKIHLLSLRVASSAEALAAFAAPLNAFEQDYTAAIGAVVRTGLPTTVCTIYNGALPPDQAEPARVALMLFNDTIYRVASALGAGVIELRAVCNQPEDYANPIEPSGEGGRKIARAIATACATT